MANKGGEANTAYHVVLYSPHIKVKEKKTSKIIKTVSTPSAYTSASDTVLLASTFNSSHLMQSTSSPPISSHRNASHRNDA